MHELILYAPFDLGFELDFLADGMKYRERLHAFREQLTKVGGHWAWKQDTRPRQTLSAYGGSEYHAPTTRPAFSAHADLSAESHFRERIEDILSSKKFPLLQTSISVQDYGIGVLELRCAAADGTWSDAHDFSVCLQEVCGDSTLIDVIRLLARQVGHDVLDASKSVEVPLCDPDAGLVHRSCLSREDANGSDPEILWFHSLCLVDNRDARFDTVGTAEWGRDVSEAGVLPTTGAFFDDAFSFKCVTASPFVTRHVHAVAIFGWGNSAVFFGPSEQPGPLADLLPVREVMRILQSFSSSLFRLNTDLLFETLDNVHRDRWHRYRVYQYQVRTLENLRVKAEMFLALMSEQRYAQSKHEQALWDRASSAWELDELKRSIHHNIDLLKTVYDRRRSLLDEHIKRQVHVGVSAVTILSAAGVLFSLIDSYVSGPDWGHIGLQALVLVGLIVLSIFLFIRPRPGKIQGHSFLDPRRPG